MIQIPKLILISLTYILGIIIGTNISISLPIIICFLLIFLLLLIVSVFVKKHPKISIFSLYASLLFSSIIYTSIPSDGSFTNLEDFIDKSVKLTGVVVSEPDIRKWQTNLVVKVEKLELSNGEAIQPKNCKVLVRIKFRKKDILYGEKYKFSGFLRIPNEGEFKRYLQRQRISATMNIGDRRKIQYIGEESGNLLIKYAFKIKKELINEIDDYISPVYFSVLGGLMFKAGVIPEQVREMFTKIGVVHILAISGLHVGVMCGIFLLLFRLCSIPRRISCGITFVLIFLYALITGLGAPVVRAGLMVNLFLLGYIIRRKTDIFITLSAAALLILLWNPYYLFDVGFQLSFITVSGIVLITPRLEKLIRIKTVLPSNFVKNSLLMLLRIFLVSVAAWIASLPLVAYYFGYISWIGPVSNLIVIPLVTLILACGFALLISIWILPFLSHFLGVGLNFLLFLLLKTSEVISSWSFVYSELPKFDLTIVFICYFTLLIFIFYPELKELINPVRNSSDDTSERNVIKRFL